MTTTVVDDTINPKQRYGDSKVNLALVPPASIEYEARALMEGARKYGPYNWRTKAVEAMTYIAANKRHMDAYLDGEDIDPESGLPHLALAKACIGILIDSFETGCLHDNRPPKGCAGDILRRDAAAAKTSQRATCPSCFLPFEGIVVDGGMRCPACGPFTLPRDLPSDLPRGIQNAETGKFAHACPDLDQEFPLIHTPKSRLRVGWETPESHPVPAK